MSEPIIVHHLNNSRSQRILFLLEELNLPYTVKTYQRGKDLLAPKELKAVHPLGKSPIVTDNGVTVIESGAIIEYIVHEKPGGDKLYPKDAPTLRKYWEYLHFAEGSLMPFLVLTLVFQQAPKQVPFFISPLVWAVVTGIQKQFVNPNLERTFGYLENELGSKEYFLGTFSAVDVQFSFPIEAAVAQKELTIESHPNLYNWVQRIHARPAYKRALAKGPEYEYGPTEA